MRRGKSRLKRPQKKPAPLPVAEEESYAIPIVPYVPQKPPREIKAPKMNRTNGLLSESRVKQLQRLVSNDPVEFLTNPKEKAITPLARRDLAFSRQKNDS